MTMKEKMLKELYRYNKVEVSYHVDITLDSYRDVYSEWDYSPFTNRDLDDDLLDYLMECSYEIGTRRNLVISFHLPQELKDEKKEMRSIEGFRHYFSYRIRKLKGEQVRQIRNTLMLTVIGVLLLVFAYFLEEAVPVDFFSKTIVEGLYIGAWVALWEIFTIWFFSITQLNYMLKHYRRLQKVVIEYIYRKLEGMQ